MTMPYTYPSDYQPGPLIVTQETSDFTGHHTWPLVGYSIGWFITGLPVAFTGLLLFWVGRKALELRRLVQS